MLERLLEQKLPIMAALESEKQFLLRDDQWALASNLAQLLEPFESVTKRLSLSSACVSQMIPFIETLKRHIERSISDTYFITQKRRMLEGRYFYLF